MGFLQPSLTAKPNPMHNGGHSVIAGKFVYLLLQTAE